MGHRILDKLGIFFSGLCVIHCVLTPFLLVLFPLFGSSFLHGDFHLYFFGLIAPIALIAFVHSFIKHGNKVPITLGFLGVGLLALEIWIAHLKTGHNHADGNVGAVLSILGGALLIFAHFLNLKSCRTKTCGHKNHQSIH